MARKKLVLVDGHSLAYRAFHALPVDLKTSQGELTNAVYGFASMLLSVLEEETPEYAIVTFDKGPSFRVRDYVEYKAHRAKMPDEMRGQMDRIREVVSALGLPIVELDDYEADDLLGTLSGQAVEAGLDVVIVTGDRDALQLVTDHIMVLTSGRRFSDTLRYTPDAVQEKYGLEPKQIIDLKALMGDKSDNIPGVSGVGQKGATGMLQKYGSLEEIYEHVDELSTRYQKALGKGRDLAFLSQHLARIVCDAPVSLDLSSASVWQNYDRDALLSLMETLEFRSLLKRLPVVKEDGAMQMALFGDEAASSVDKGPLGKYHLVADGKSLEALAASLRDRLTADPTVPLPLTVDTETTGTDPLQADLVGISLTDRSGEAWYVPVRAPKGDPVLSLDSVIRCLGPLLADPTIPKQGHNLKYDLQVLRRAGLPLEGVAFDTMIAEWVVNPDSPNLGLKNMAWARLGVQMTEIKTLIGSGAKQKTMDEVPLDQVVPYACADADISHRLVEKVRPELVSHQQLDLFYDLEMPLIAVLADMEMAGVRLDIDWLTELSDELSNRLQRQESEIYQLAGEEFNVKSTQQLSKVLFETLQLPTRGLRKTKSGYYSTRAEVLEGLRSEHPIVEHVLKHRELAKLRSTYVVALSALANPQTGRVHTSYNQIGTVTGRLSSSNPNLQNIPIRTEEGRRVRKAFVAQDGCLLVGADYSQVELRVMAHISNDPGMVAAFQRGEDVHATTAAAVFDVSLDAVTYDMRRIAKAVNFGLIYGQGAYGLASQIGVTLPEAEGFIRRYFERFPRVREYMDWLQKEAAQQGYVETLLHRRRYFPELERKSKAPASVRQSALRMAINAPIQGTAADIMKLAMLRMHRMLREKSLAARMILQVHDEIVLETPEEELLIVIAALKEAMEGAFELIVPLKVDVEIGQNWEEMEPWQG